MGCGVIVADAPTVACLVGRLDESNQPDVAPGDLHRLLLDGQQWQFAGRLVQRHGASQPHDQLVCGAATGQGFEGRDPPPAVDAFGKDHPVRRHLFGVLVEDHVACYRQHMGLDVSSIAEAKAHGLAHETGVGCGRMMHFEQAAAARIAVGQRRQDEPADPVRHGPVMRWGGRLAKRVRFGVYPGHALIEMIAALLSGPAHVFLCLEFVQSS